MEQHPNRPKLINLLIDFEEKVEASMNKKYRPFVKNMLSLSNLSSTISKEAPLVTRQLIVFKLGMESKSVKAIEVSLTFLVRLFEGKFININEGDFTEGFIIMENEVKETKVQQYSRRVKDMLVKTLQELVHFKNPNIDSLLIKAFQCLLSENILTPILQLSERNNPLYFNLLTSYFSYRFFFLEETILYTQAEMDYISRHVPKSHRMLDQIKKAVARFQSHKKLVGMYVNQAISKMLGEGGRYGQCVVCHRSSDHFCKDTQASVCSPTCKQEHLEIADYLQGNYTQSNQLYTSLVEGLKELFQFTRGRPQILSVFIQLIDVLLKKSYLCMVVKQQISQIFYRQIPPIVAVLYTSNSPKCQRLLFGIMASLVNIYKHLFLNDIQRFFTTKVIGQLEQKKPRLENIQNINRFLLQIFTNGQNFIELYANLDTSLNRENVMQKLMYQLARILQERFGSGDYTKANRIALKKQCLQIHCTLIQNILAIPFDCQYPVDIDVIICHKNKKTSLQKFILKFNESWNAGLKSLFNLNLATLDNKDEEMLNIVTSIRLIKKSSILEYMMQPTNVGAVHRHIKQIDFDSNSLMESLLEYYLIFPLPENIIFQGNKNDPLNIFTNAYKSHSSAPNIEEQIIRWMQVFKDANTSTVDRFRQTLQHQQTQYDERQLYLLFAKVHSLHNPYTQSFKSKLFHFCNNPRFIQLIQGQLNLLQICISHLLEGEYQISRTLSLIRMLQQLCPHTPNLFTLIIKNTNLEFVLTQQLTPENIQCVSYLIQVPELIPDCVADWHPILRFYNDVFYFTLGACLTPVTMENKRRLLGLNLNQMSINFLKISAKISDRNFPKFANGMLKIAIQEVSAERTFLLQKGFNIINTDVDKFVDSWDQIFPNIQALILKQLHQQIALFAIHSLKENLVLAKQYRLNDQSEVRYFQLFSAYYNRFASVSLRSALLETVCYVVQNQFLFSSQSWKIIFTIVNQYVGEGETHYQGVYRIIQKIMAENLLLLIDFFPDLFSLLQSVCTTNSKVSFKALIDLRILFEFLFKKSHQDSSIQQEAVYRQKCSVLINNKLPEILDWMTLKFGIDTFDTCIEVFFQLIKIQILEDQDQANKHLDIAFAKIVSDTKAQKQHAFQVSQCFIAEAVSLGARMKYFYVLQCLSQIVTMNFDELSFLAIKGIKSFIQILNPQKSKQWKDVTRVLVEIIEQSRTKNIQSIERIKESLKEVNLMELIQSSKQLPEFQELQETSIIMNKLIIQKSAIELLPNDPKCLILLKDIYRELRGINDNMALRLCLWKAGFGRGLSDVPSLLSLQEIVVNRILSTYSFNSQSKSQQVEARSQQGRWETSNNKPLATEFFEFSSEILQRYSSISAELSKLQPLLQDRNTNRYQYGMLSLLEIDLGKKKHLSQKFVRFLLPKLYQHNFTAEIRLRIGMDVVSLLGWLDSKSTLVKLAKSLL